jgi:hypothetical protein
MAAVKWEIAGREFSNCNCAYGCPCQFNALPTKGFCQAVAALEVREGHHGKVRLDGLKAVLVMSWPGAIHEGNGEALAIIDKRADEAQREALLRILSGQDTKPGATIFQALSGTFANVRDPVFAEIDFTVNVDKRTARVRVPGYVEGHGEPIRNPVTGDEFRGQIVLPDGFEFTKAEAGRGWSKATGPVAFELADSHGHFADLHLNQDGVVR